MLFLDIIVTHCYVISEASEYSNVSFFLLQYCLIENTNGVRTFKIATLQDIMKHRVIVVTLSISMNLSTIGLQKGN